MADDDNSIPSSPLDHTVDEKIIEAPVSNEKYKNDVAGTHVKERGLRDASGKSKTMGEIERTVQSDILGSKGNQKLGTFGLQMSRKGDFRLKDLTRRLEMQIRTDYKSNINSGPVANRVRDFDVRSQSLRMISANSALGSYQFQKNQVLPYMRKDLALSYEKVELLKQVVGGIGSLERAVVSKLEAIKMNTAKAAPEKRSYLGAVMAKVKEKNIDRIAGNISDLTMDRYDELYQKHVSPVFDRLHQIMSDGSGRGGLNGVNRAVTQKLNNLRHATARMAGRDTSTMGIIGKLQTNAAKVAKGALGTGVRLTQGRKLPDGLNSFVSGHLKSYTSFWDRLHPFGRSNKVVMEGNDEAGDAKLALAPTMASTSMDKLTSLFQSWRLEYRRDNDHLLENVSAIRYSLAPPKSLPSTKGPKVSVKPNAIPPQTMASPRSAPRFTVASIKASIGSRVPTIPKINMPTMKMSSIKLPHLSITPLHHIAQKTHDIHESTKNSMGVLIGSLTDRLSKIDLTLKKSDVDRTKFEKSETKRESLLDKLAAKAKVRKGSYEDIEGQQQSKGLAGLLGMLSLGKAGTEGGALGADAAESGAAAGAGTAASGTGSTGTLLGLLGGGLATVGRGALKYGWKGAKLGTKYGFKGAKKAVPFAAKNGLKGLWALTKLGSKGALGAGKITTKLGVKGALGATKLGATGLLKFAKSGFGLGLAAGVGDHFLQKSNASATTKRAGGTALEMASWGSTGAEIGSFVGPEGTIIGGLVGAAVGAIVANSDYAAKALHALGHGAVSTVGGLFTDVFGQSAIVGPDGKVQRQEKSSVLGNIKTAFFGRDAKYSSSGEVIEPGKLSIVGKINYGFQKTFFGDKFDNGEYKEGTSLISEIGSSISKTLASFGKEIMALPGQVKRGFGTMVTKVEQAAKYGKDKVVAGATAAGGYIATKAGQAKVGVQRGVQRVGDLYRNLTFKNVESFASDAGSGVMNAINPVGFIVGASSAAFGWSTTSGDLTSPSSPYYAFVTQVLAAYGIKDRNQYKFINALEVSQDKVNNGQAKPFDDSDMAYMAGRFGFDPKNKDQVNYFKLWYKRRFLPGMALVNKVLKAHKLTFGSVLSTDEKQMLVVNDELKKEILSSDLNTVGLEPSLAAYNKFAKIGSADPGGMAGGAAIKAKPFDPRDPKNRDKPWLSPDRVAADAKRLADFTKPNYGPGSDSSGPGSGSTPASRINASIVKGGVKDQPEFKSAYQKLSPEIKKAIDKSPALQFTLWSTSVQHGPDNAVKMFMKDYSGTLDDKAIIRSIYQDRSTKFADLDSGDRSQAISDLGNQERFAEGIAGGATPDMATMGKEASNVLSPAGNSNAGFDTSNIKPAPVTGDVASRAKDAVNYLMTKKYTKIAAMGIIGNLIAESKLATNAKGDPSSPGGAHGIAQWHADRRAAIAKQFGKPVESMDLHGQLDALDWEIRSGHGITGGKNLAGDLNAAKDVGEVVKDMVYRYERPGDKPGQTMLRTKYALGLQKTLGTDGGAANDKSAPAAGGTTPASASSAPTPAKAATPATKATPAAAPAGSGGSTALAASLDNHAQHLQNNTAAIKAHTASGGQPASVSSPTVVHAPTTNNNANTGGVTGWLAMTMKKAQVAVGEL